MEEKSQALLAKTQGTESKEDWEKTIVAERVSQNLNHGEGFSVNYPEPGTVASLTQ